MKTFAFFAPLRSVFPAGFANGNAREHEAAADQMLDFARFFDATAA